MNNIKVALSGTSLNPIIIDQHIKVERDGDVKYIDAIVYGEVIATVKSVFIDGKNPIVKGDISVEFDSYQLDTNETYVDGAHNYVNGSVIDGNSSNVYVEGKLVSNIGSQVLTHSNQYTSLSSSNSSSTVTIG